MQQDNPQFGGAKITKTSKARDIITPKAKISLITDTEELNEPGQAPIVLDKPMRMSGAGTAKEMGEIFKSIAAMKRD